MTRERTPLGRGDLGRDAERLDVLLGGRASALPPEAGGDMFSKIVLYHGDGAKAEFFDVNDSGLAASIAAVTGTDTIAIPPAADATFTSAITIPTNTAVQGTGTQTTFISAAVTMSANSFLRDVTVKISANSAANLTGVVGTASGTAYMNTVSVQITQSGAGDAYGVEMAAGDLFARSCFISGTSTGGTGNGVKSGAGDIYIEEGSAVQGSAAAISGTNTFSIDSDKFIHLHDITNTNYNWIFTFDATGMAAAIVAVASGDIIKLPAGTLAGNYTIAAGTEVRGAGITNTILSGTITNNGIIGHLQITGSLTNGGVARYLFVNVSTGTGITQSAVGAFMSWVWVNMQDGTTYGINASEGRIFNTFVGTAGGKTSIGIIADGVQEITNSRFAGGAAGGVVEGVEKSVTNCHFNGASNTADGLRHLTSGTVRFYNCSFYTPAGDAGVGLNLDDTGGTFVDCSWSEITGQIGNMAYGTGDRAPYSIGARVYNDANINTNNATTTLLTFNQEHYDTETIHSTVANTSRLTCPTDGKYIIMAVVAFDSNATGTRQLSIRLNGATYLGIKEVLANVAASNTRLNISLTYDLSATDYVEVIAYQSSGGALNVKTAANHTPEFMMHRLTVV